MVNKIIKWVILKYLNIRILLKLILILTKNELIFGSKIIIFLIKKKTKYINYNSFTEVQILLGSSQLSLI